MSAFSARRRRTAAIVATGIAAEIAVLVPSGTVDALFFPGVPGVTAAVIAAIVAILAGPAGGAVVAVAGWSLYYPLIADGRPGTLVALPFWVGGVVTIGLVAERLRNAEHRARTRAERLQTVTDVALTHLALDDLLRELLGRTVELLGTDTGAVLLVDESGKVLVPRAARGLEESVEAGVPVPIGEGFSGRIAAERTPRVVEEVRGDEVYSPFLRARVRSLLGVPLLLRGEVLGVLYVGSREPRRFTGAETELLELVADRFALAIRQSHLFEAERDARNRFAFMSEASALLGRSLDYQAALREVATLAVGAFADWCVVDLVRDGQIERLLIHHSDAARVAAGQAFSARFGVEHGEYGPATVATTGRVAFAPAVSDEMVEAVSSGPEHLVELRALGVRSYMSVPVLARGEPLGAITFMRSENPVPFAHEDLAAAKDFGRRAGAAIDTARLYRAAEERARAARALAHIGEGVVLVDRRGLVQYWNPAAASITGIAEEDAVGLALDRVLPNWEEIEELVPVADWPALAQSASRAAPVELRGRELWLSFSGIRFEEGRVYAFRDVTEEQGLRALQADFVATVSHELRTPLAAVYGAAMTVQREGISAEDREHLFSVIVDQADRLAHIIDDVLWMSRLDSGRLELHVARCDAAELAERVVEGARMHAPERVSLVVQALHGLPPVAADPDKLRQVLVNLVDNGVKYSPEGGTVTVAITESEGRVRFSVRDEGLGIPHRHQQHVFEKFYRLDPNQTRGVGGTGLGLYICRELVQRMGGSIWLSSSEGEGSTFVFDLPAAEARRPPAIPVEVAS
jgi:two-component system, OmpR family, phosphate regulon sensor histidine kinase PhoR